jgi:formate dehydrogenase subunit gamma
MATQTHTLPRRKLLRYRIGPRINHAILAGSFVILLFTGLILLWSPLAGLAAGGNSRLLHRIAAVFFMAVPVLYLLLDRPAAKELLWDSFHYDKDDLAWAKQAYRYFLGHAKDMPPQGRLNAGQKLHHAAVVVMSALIVASGLVLWFGKGTLGADGLAVTAMVHDVTMLILTVLLVGHLYFTFVYKALSGMTTGYVPEEEARLEHSKWVEELPQQAPYVVDEGK